MEDEHMAWKRLVKVNKLRENAPKMVPKGIRTYTVVMFEGSPLVTNGLCRHMRWPLGWGGKVNADGCLQCPLHQTQHHLPSGKLSKWSPFPIWPFYGRILGKLSRRKDLTMYDSRIVDGWIEADV